MRDPRAEPAPDAYALRERDHISSWSLSQRVQPGTCALNDFHFEHPRANLQVKSSMPREHAFSCFELYEYRGEYGRTADGDDYARERIEAAHATQAVTNGASNASRLTTGGLFKLREHPRRNQNREYLIVASEYRLQLDDHEGLDATPTPVYHRTFRHRALHWCEGYRSSRRRWWSRHRTRTRSTDVMDAPQGG